MTRANILTLAAAARRTRLDRRTFLKAVGLAAVGAGGLPMPKSFAQEVPWSKGTAGPKFKVPANAADCHHHRGRSGGASVAARDQIGAAIAVEVRGPDFGIKLRVAPEIDGREKRRCLREHRIAQPNRYQREKKTCVALLAVNRNHGRS